MVSHSHLLEKQGIISDDSEHYEQEDYETKFIHDCEVEEVENGTLSSLNQQDHSFGMQLFKNN